MWAKFVKGDHCQRHSALMGLLFTFINNLSMLGTNKAHSFGSTNRGLKFKSISF